MHIRTLICFSGISTLSEKHFALLRSQSFLELVLVSGAS